jgi:small subunit ribosomal protein S20
VANIKSAEKRARQSVKRRAHNMAARSRLRSAMKKVQNAAQEGSKDEAVAGLKQAVPVIDAMVNKGIIHRNKAARHKSQLNAAVKRLSSN